MKLWFYASTSKKRYFNVSFYFVFHYLCSRFVKNVTIFEERDITHTAP
ncbi:MAG: hypothetical protein JWR18_3980 [Segetibacter sp.]|jgi:hypothetical protein|nr:hypothetical protein [Segetibacter sp.]